MTCDITVAICTYNRAGLLGGAVESVCKQAVAIDCFEILVVDNGSGDRTADVIQDCQRRFPNHRIVFVAESEQGLGFARTTALQNAAGRYIAYLDDDARAAPDWIAQALAMVREHADKLICLGGPILPLYTTPKPDWFRDQYESRTWGEKARRLQYGESFSGSNMIWHKETLRSLGGFNNQLGVKGETLSVGEESDVFLKAWRHLDSPLFYYSPDLRVLHWVPPFKMKVRYQLKRYFVSGQVAVRLKEKLDFSWRLRAAARNALDLVSLSFCTARQFRRYKYWQNWVVEEGEVFSFKLGYLLAALRIFLPMKQR